MVKNCASSKLQIIVPLYGLAQTIDQPQKVKDLLSEVAVKNHGFFLLNVEINTNIRQQAFSVEVR